MPGAGSSSYRATTGPGRTLTISPFTPKSSSTPSSSRAFCSSASCETLAPTDFFGSVSMVMEGMIHSPRARAGMSTMARIEVGRPAVEPAIVAGPTAGEGAAP